MDSYDPSTVEEKWQQFWDKNGTNTVSRSKLLSARDPYYNLMMFPYPSAEGLHIGNIFAYTGADIQGRYQRLLGKDVFEPIGFDAFGIHSENYALKIGSHPSGVIPQNVGNFEEQLRRIGGMFDWNHTVDTTDPDYYRWTQWIFVKLFEAGLVERREAPVNWCPSCKTVLANEQVIQGVCERCDSAVEQRRMPQWFFRITKYADRLLRNIETLDWSDRTRKAQRNWIGKSVGATVLFQVEDNNDPIEVFTTRPDTLFGATYMVLAPEHPFVEQICSAERQDEVSDYVNEVSKRDLVERQKIDREKTGVFTGGYCINPVNDARIPIWISDYVLLEYGTGAIMAVPGHDERDFEFATKFKLPIPRVIAASSADAQLPLDEAFSGDGVLVNSGSYDGLSVAEGKNAIVADLEARGLGAESITYRLHDWCISRQRYWGPPIPVIHCDSCGAVAVPEKELPVELPHVEDYRPDDEGNSPLAKALDWVEVDCPECGNSARRETDVSDTFLDSSWYFLRYPCTDDDSRAIDAELLKKWLPVTSYIGGNEHAVLHLLYARFITMALHDIGLIDFEEPFEKFRAHGTLIKDGAKISKSRGNIIVPEDLILEYGADTVRLYLMFLGPFEQGGEYREDGIQGAKSFLNRLWHTVVELVEGEGDPDVMAELHRTIKHVSEDIPALRYNTAIARLMEYLNVVRHQGRKAKRVEVEPVVTMVAPFAPHIAEELFEKLGHRCSIFDHARWPDFDPAMTSVDTVEIGVQVNGRPRGTIELGLDATETDALALANEHPNVRKFLESAEVKKVIFVPGRMLSLVVA